MDLSIIIPLYNEVESLNELYQWIVKSLQDQSYQYEMIFVDDGSSDGSWDEVSKLSNSDPRVSGIKFRRNYGKSAALFCGFEAASGNVVITMDADLQDSPEEIPSLYKMITEEKYDMVAGWKKIRHDPFSKTFPSKLWNYTARKVSGLKLHDFNCGLKAYRLDVVKSIEVYGEMHRYIPIIASRAGFRKIGEKIVVHQERKYGKSKFGVERIIKGFLDLLSLNFISKFSKRPMHLFGTLGIIMFLSGGIVSAWIIAKKIYQLYHHLPIREVTEQPLFYLALVAVILGVQLFVAGFLGELISRNSTERNKYHVQSRLNISGK
ncbi:MAG: glycosyltransferase family 2 protein [Bacteroidia bacterium]|nr:glycosyltransferase family 2 protein [Bacteroidia bacterium]